MADLVDDVLRDAVADLVLVIARLHNRSLVDRNPIGEVVAVPPTALGERRPLIQPEQRVARLDLEFLQEVVGRFVFDEHSAVVHLVTEMFLDGLSPGLVTPLELLARHRRARARGFGLVALGFLREITFTK